ncbi:MAG: flagellin [Phenylobacterium sp.]|uniref:flagellin n=1 Tax=Phenylobacterium sp. TaxID=1871053 RepID=UPI0025E3B769|nr:flagellin [Phenylobacterium sp.]MCA6227066.1 flagellin [Phenylobacterium sp.]MCA6230683.1 flagellin [Phenylobacterium sp.]MCA6234063.1 flagellin [Phenylobacterium sp.]MCA6249863.1 flagellin [Phenylobacterium sp.]MCA6251028.1 flagellin [Phenylobacterium sp.]
MAASINTNYAAMLAAQNVNATTEMLSGVQQRIATGLKVSSAKDNGAIYGIALRQQATSQSLNAVRESLQRAQSVTDVSLAAGETITDLLVQMKEKALAAIDTTISATDRQALATDFAALRTQINTAANNSGFNGASLISNTAVAIQALADDTGTRVISIQVQRLFLGSTNMAVTTTTSLGTTAQASNALSLVNRSITQVALSLSRIGTGSKALANHTVFINKLQDAIDAGVGNIIDADMAKEASRLQSVQAKQQLGFQALAIANQGPSNLLSLFR